MSKPNLMKYASEIRKDGEAWDDAVQRARVELYGEESTKKSTKKSVKGSSRQPGESPADFRTRKNAKQ